MVKVSKCCGRCKFEKKITCCGRCKFEKKFTELYKNKRKQDGHQNYCKPCMHKNIRY
jgi:hypothetical protein